MASATKKLISVSDENSLRKKILETHASDSVTFDSGAVLSVVEEILNLVTLGVVTTPNGSTSQIEKRDLTTVPGGLNSLLHKISCMLACKCSGGESHTSAIEILKLLSSYKWEAKIVIVLASYVVDYAQFNLVTELCTSNPLAKLIAILKHIPENIDNSDLIKSKFETIVSLVKLSIEVTKCITKISNLPSKSKYITNDAEPMVVALKQMPIAVYWMTRAVAWASQITEILGISEVSHTETWDHSSLEQKIVSIQSTFSAQLQLCNEYIAEKELIECSGKIKWWFEQSIRETTKYVDNQEILQLIIYVKDGYLLKGTTKVGVDVLKGKTVLLLISDLEISDHEIHILSNIYKTSRNDTNLQYEIVWLTIAKKVAGDDDFDKKFDHLKIKMPWYTLEHPSLLKPGVIKYVKEEWHFSKKPILVALDPLGKVSNSNAYHMLWTWKNAAYPFTTSRELDLWSREEWSLQLLNNDIDPTISKWIKEDKVICLYGGEDSRWIQDFIKAAKNVENDAKIKLEMVYVGKNKTKESIKKFVEISFAGEDLTCTWYFWTRIESMMHSKIHHGAKVASTEEKGDYILAEVINMLTLGANDHGWGLISQGAGSGPGKIARATWNVILTALQDIKKWKAEADTKGFVVALNEYLANCHTKEHCNRVILPGVDDIPKMIVCAECHRPMERYIMYSCCNE